MPAQATFPYLAKATIKYKSPHKQDLAFAKGDTIRVTGIAPKNDDQDDDDDDDDDWLVGETLDGSRGGTFPGSFVQPTDEPDTAQSHQADAAIADAVNPPAAPGAIAAEVPEQLQSSAVEKSRRIKPRSSHRRLERQHRKARPNRRASARPSHLVRLRQASRTMMSSAAPHRTSHRALNFESRSADAPSSQPLKTLQHQCSCWLSCRWCCRRRRHSFNLANKVAACRRHKARWHVQLLPRSSRCLQQACRVRSAAAPKAKPGGWKRPAPASTESKPLLPGAPAAASSTASHQSTPTYHHHPSRAKRRPRQSSLPRAQAEPSVPPTHRVASR